MDTKNQVQLIKSQIMNMKLQIDNIDIQNNNMFMMNNDQIGEQLINLSIQILNTGIQTFNIGKNIFINYNKYIDQLKLISEQINLLINGNNMIQQQQMMQQQMMIPPPMMMQPILNEQNNDFVRKKSEIYNVIFKPCSGFLPCFNIVAYEGMPIKELLDKYKNSIKGKLKENEINKLKFYSSALRVGFGIRRLNREDDIRKVTSNFNNAIILVEQS